MSRSHNRCWTISSGNDKKRKAREKIGRDCAFFVMILNSEIIAPANCHMWNNYSTRFRFFRCSHSNFGRWGGCLMLREREPKGRNFHPISICRTIDMWATDKTFCKCAVLFLIYMKPRASQFAIDVVVVLDVYIVVHFCCCCCCSCCGFVVVFSCYYCCCCLWWWWLIFRCCYKFIFRLLSKIAHSLRSFFVRNSPFMQYALKFLVTASKAAGESQSVSQHNIVAVTIVSPNVPIQQHNPPPPQKKKKILKGSPTHSCIRVGGGSLKHHQEKERWRRKHPHFKGSWQQIGLPLSTIQYKRGSSPLTFFRHHASESTCPTVLPT